MCPKMCPKISADQHLSWTFIIEKGHWSQILIRLDILCSYFKIYWPSSDRHSAKFLIIRHIRTSSIDTQLAKNDFFGIRDDQSKQNVEFFCMTCERNWARLPMTTISLIRFDHLSLSIWNPLFSNIIDFHRARYVWRIQ